MEAIVTQLPVIETQAAEPRPSIGARIGGTLRNGYDAFIDRVDILKDQATTLITIGGVALVGAQAAELAVNADRADAAGNTPALTGATTLLGSPEAGILTASTDSTSSLEQLCASVALAKPEIVTKPILSHAGIRLQQILRGSFNYPSLEDLPDPDGSGGTVDCAPEYIRTSGVQQEIKKGDRWVKIGPPNATGAWGNHAQHASLTKSPSSATPAYVYSECINGQFEKNRITIYNYLKTGETGHRRVVAQKSYTMPVPAMGSCRAAVRSRKQTENLAQ